jgi:Protein of unknown function (DUF3667)
MTTCLNCDNSFEGSFCNLCGQKASTHRFTMGEWLHEIPHSVLHVDSGFFLTVKTLILHHGNAIREYLQGKRKLLFSPFLYVLVWCGVYVVISHFFENPNETVKQFELKNLPETFEYINERYYKIIIILMIIPMTIASYLTYIRSGYNFAENLVLNAYLIGQLVIADIIILLISASSFGQEYKLIVKVIEFLIKFPYWFLMYWKFFRPSKWYWGILQYVISQILMGILIYLLMLLSAFILLKTQILH